MCVYIYLYIIVLESLHVAATVAFTGSLNSKLTGACVGVFVQIWLTLGAGRLSVLVHSTGLVAGTYQFLGVLPMLFISSCFSSPWLAGFW